MASFYPANVPLVNYFFYNYTLTTDGPSLPLAGGFVFFFDNDNRTEPKNTYSDVSDPNNPVVNPNPLELNAIGAWPFFYAETGEYYIVVTGPDQDLDNPIWTLENINFEGDAGSSSENIINYIPNGQFLLHNDLPATDGYDAGEIRQASTDIAYGGWTFERPADSTATDIVTFERYDEWSDNPTGNPRWAVRVQCTTFDSGDAYKDIRITFPNVNRFASTQEYTFSLSGMDNEAGSYPLELYLIKNFGTGGDDETETLLTTFNLTPDESDFYFAFTFGTNADKIIGSDDDDFVALALRLRTDETADISLTDMCLQSGNLSEPPYPETTQQQDVSAALGGAFPVPNPDGSDLFLLPRLTKSGWVYDDSEIGDVVMETQTNVYVDSLHPDTNRMLANGTQYSTTGYSPLGIPYSRLQERYWIESIQTPRYGTGRDYFTGIFSGSGNELRITNNSLGAVTNAADVNTTFTIDTIHTGADYKTKSFLYGANSFYIQNLNAGAVTAPAANTSGFTVFIAQTGNSTVPQIVGVITVAAAALAGTYFTFYTYNAVPERCYVWYQVDGVGADPALPASIGILVKLLSTDTNAIVAQKTREALNGWQVTTVQTVAASSVPAGSYFNINAITALGAPVAYYVWYKKDGAGNDPAPGGRTGIQVDIAGSDTNTQVASKTQRAINMKFFSAPDLRGLFLRGVDDGANNDPDASIRWSLVPGIIGDTLGTFQLSENISHTHTYSQVEGGAVFAGGVNYQNNDLAQTVASGGKEARPYNANVTLAIKY